MLDHQRLKAEGSSPGVNVINILSGPFTNADTKSAKKTDGLTVFFALLGSVHVKVARRMLVKSTPVFHSSKELLQLSTTGFEMVY
jgi:hypothetical protein